MSRKKKGDQPELPGVMEQTVDHPDITRAAKQLQALRHERGEISAKLKKLGATLAEKMKAKGLKTYVTKTLVVECEETDHIKIRDLGAEEGEGTEAA